LSGWVTIPAPRSKWRFHVLVPLFAAAMALFGRDLWVRYLLLVATVLIHESGHALTALCLGSKRVEVSVWPVFARANVEHFPDRREAWIAAAGPAVNLAAAALFFALGGSWDLQLARAPLLDFMATVNLIMGAGNLLPVVPADGGRMIRALRRYA
jgi:Zn-dependent protease